MATSLKSSIDTTVLSMVSSIVKAYKLRGGKTKLTTTKSASYLALFSYSTPSSAKNHWLHQQAVNQCAKKLVENGWKGKDAKAVAVGKSPFNKAKSFGGVISYESPNNQYLVTLDLTGDFTKGPRAGSEVVKITVTALKDVH